MGKSVAEKLPKKDSISAATVLSMLPVLPMRVKRYFGSCPIRRRNSLRGEREYRGEARQKHLVGHHTAREQFDKFLCILFDKAFGTVVIPLLSLQLNPIGLVPGQKIVPFTSDLLPPCM